MDIDERIGSTDDKRVINNVMWHEYRVLSAVERDHMKTIKDKGLDFYHYLNSVGTSREMSLAKTRVEEAVMWAVKHVTGG